MKRSGKIYIVVTINAKSYDASFSGKFSATPSYTFNPFFVAYSLIIAEGSTPSLMPMGIANLPVPIPI